MPYRVECIQNLINYSIYPKTNYRIYTDRVGDVQTLG